jgi:uroporphyrinogen-III synthase
MTRVVSTLSPGALDGLADALRADRVELELVPLLRVGPPADPGPFAQALARIERYRAVAFTSPRAAAAFAGAWAGRREIGRPFPDLWAAGRATAAPLVDRWGTVRVAKADRVGALGAAAALGRAMIDAGVGSPVLHPAGEERRPELGRTLAAAGVSVDLVSCYRMVPAEAADLAAAARRGGVLIVGSPLVVRRLAGATLPRERPRLVALGPTTAAAAREAGWIPDAVASAPNVAAAAAAVRELLASREG